MTHPIHSRRRPSMRGVVLAAALGALAAAPLPAQTKALGIDTTGFDRSVRPQDDFFRFVNGGWLKTVQIPPDRSGWGMSMMLAQRSEATIRQILDEAVATHDAAPGSDVQKLGDLYASFMDSARIEQHGIKPLRADLARIRAIRGPADYPAAFMA